MYKVNKLQIRHSDRNHPDKKSITLKCKIHNNWIFCSHFKKAWIDYLNKYILLLNFIQICNHHLFSLIQYKNCLSNLKYTQIHILHIMFKKNQSLIFLVLYSLNVFQMLKQNFFLIFELDNNIYNFKHCKEDSWFCRMK